MSKSDAYESAILKLLFNATAIANVADNAASGPLSSLQVSLHTADPGETGTQGTNETSYTGYARVPLARSTASSGWVVTNNSVSPVSVITFGTATSTSTGTITHFAVGATTASTGGVIYYKGPVTPNINFGQNVVPRLTTGSSIQED
jgi:hypothetical protein